MTWIVNTLFDSKPRSVPHFCFQQQKLLRSFCCWTWFQIILNETTQGFSDTFYSSTPTLLGTLRNLKN